LAVALPIPPDTPVISAVFNAKYPFL